MKILLLEDDIALNDILSDFLSDNDFEVTSCENGEDALEKLIENRFDLAILDINTPSLSGLEVLIELRNRYKNNIPIIIILSGESSYHVIFTIAMLIKDTINSTYHCPDNSVFLFFLNNILINKTAT